MHTTTYSGSSGKNNHTDDVEVSKPDKNPGIQYDTLGFHQRLFQRVTYKQKEYTQWPENNSQPRAKPAQLCIKDPPKERRKECYLINVVVGPIIGWVTQSEPTSWGNKKIYCLQGRVSSSLPQLCCTGKVKLLLAGLSITSHFSESVATLCFYMPVDKEEFQAHSFSQPTRKRENGSACARYHIWFAD